MCVLKSGIGHALDEGDIKPVSLTEGMACATDARGSVAHLQMKLGLQDIFDMHQPQELDSLLL